MTLLYLTNPVIIGTDLQQQYRISSDWAPSGYMYFHQGLYVLTSTVWATLDGLKL